MTNLFTLVVVSEKTNHFVISQIGHEKNRVLCILANCTCTRQNVSQVEELQLDHLRTISQCVKFQSGHVVQSFHLNLDAKHQHYRLLTSGLMISTTITSPRIYSSLLTSPAVSHIEIKSLTKYIGLTVVPLFE